MASDEKSAWVPSSNRVLNVQERVLVSFPSLHWGNFKQYSLSEMSQHISSRISECSLAKSRTREVEWCPEIQRGICMIFMSRKLVLWQQVFTRFEIVRVVPLLWSRQSSNYTRGLRCGRVAIAITCALRRDLARDPSTTLFGRPEILYLAVF